MRALFLVLALTCWASSAGAIENTYVKLLQSDLKTNRGDLLVRALNLSPEQAEVFRPIQEDYQKEMNRIDTYRRELIQEYAAVGSGMSEQIAGAMVQQFLDLEEKELKVRTKVIEKMEEKLSPKLAADFYRIDTQLNLMIQLQTTSRLRL